MRQYLGCSLDLGMQLWSRAGTTFSGRSPAEGLRSDQKESSQFDHYENSPLERTPCPFQLSFQACSRGSVRVIDYRTVKELVRDHILGFGAAGILLFVFFVFFYTVSAEHKSFSNSNIINHSWKVSLKTTQCN